MRVTLLSNAWRRAGEVAERTPSRRNRTVDFWRAVSILVVVLGHWLMAAPELQADGSLQAGHVLVVLPWSQWLTWVLQVMPVFFMVGGYANAASWEAAISKGEPYGEWLHGRLRRLALPVLPVLATWAVIAVVALALGLDPALLKVGSQTALVPVWFLAVYVGVAALAPLALAGWRRLGWWSFATLAAGAVLADVAFFLADQPALGWTNYLFVWAAVHQLGIAWHQGGLSGTRRRLLLGGVGLAVLLFLVQALDYPVSMVGVPGEEISNTLPPKITLLGLGMFQTGLILAAEPVMRRLLDRRRVWAATVLINTQIMTLYLWHLTAMVAAIGLLMAAGGLGLRVAAGSPTWWLTRPLWIVAMAVLTLPLLAIFSRFERPRAGVPPPPAWRGALGVAGICTGLGLLAYFGIGNEDGLNWIALAITGAGTVGGRVVGTARRSESPTPFS